MQFFNVVVLHALFVGNEAAQVNLRAAPKTAIGGVAAKLPAGFSISDCDADGNGVVTWKELSDALTPLKIPRMDTATAKEIVTKFSKTGAKEGATAGLDKQEFAKMIAYFKKEAADALIPKNPDKFDTGCYIVEHPITEDEDKGYTYRGLVSSTVSGRTCQNWLDTHPHDIKGKYELEATAKNGMANHNFCRNPDKSMSKPWCFTMDPTTPKEECEIPLCEGMSRKFQDEADDMSKEVAAGLECDCIAQLYGSTTTTADTAVPLSLLAEAKKQFGEANLEAAKKKCKCKRGTVAVLKRKRRFSGH